MSNPYWNDIEERAQAHFGIDAQQLQRIVQQQLDMHVAQAWGAEHSELDGELQHNVNALKTVLDRYGWEINPANLDAAYVVAKSNDMLKISEESQQQQLHQPQAVQQPNPTVSQLERPAYVKAVTGKNGEIITRDVTEDEFINKAPLDEVREFLEKKYGKS